MASIEYYATGRRKTSTARVFLRPGKGAITVNHREFDKFFTTDALRMPQEVARLAQEEVHTWRIEGVIDVFNSGTMAVRADCSCRHLT